ncbi:MAG: helix-turn-helix transcriptional regulator [Clostridia bacterium]|nr:helix-turn-helix transcriptional regulator [Clostridia bacterium]
MNRKSRIRDLREDNDLTQQQVADKIGITQRKYSYIETGVQPLTDEILIKLALLYDTSIDYILMQTDCRQRYK